VLAPSINREMTIGLVAEGSSTSETSANFYRTTRCYKPEDSHLASLLLITEINYVRSNITLKHGSGCLINCDIQTSLTCISRSKPVFGMTTKKRKTRLEWKRTSKWRVLKWNQKLLSLVGRENEMHGWSIVASYEEKDVCHKDPDSIMTSTLLNALLLACGSPPFRSAGVFSKRSIRERRSRLELVVLERWSGRTVKASEFIVLEP
jgi:hypothetical protein